MNTKYAYKILTILIATVWFVNGLYCKLLNFAPRHQEIVAKILGSEYALLLTKGIGFLEVLMVGWILSGHRSKLCAISQITIILSMNVVEFILAKDLLLFGGVNIIFALLFSAVIYYNEYRLKEKFVQS